MFTMKLHNTFDVLGYSWSETIKKGNQNFKNKCGNKMICNQL